MDKHNVLGFPKKTYRIRHKDKIMEKVHVVHSPQQFLHHRHSDSSKLLSDSSSSESTI